MLLRPGTGVPLNAACFMRPQGALGVRQLAAALRTSDWKRQQAVSERLRL